jgi:hypothetical protein
MDSERLFALRPEFGSVPNPDDSNRVIGVYGDARIGTIHAKPIVTALTSS